MKRLVDPPPVDRLREVLSYDPETGVFIRLHTKGNRLDRVGREAGTISNYGYRIIYVDGQRYVAHRLAWLFIHNQWPPAGHEIDHINGDKADNRIVNLRLATISQNKMNTPRRRTNTSGRTGVHIEPSTGKWQARIWVDGKPRHLGLFDDFEAAVKAREAAERQVYGEFRHQKQEAVHAGA